MTDDPESTPYTVEVLAEHYEALRRDAERWRKVLELCVPNSDLFLAMFGSYGSLSPQAFTSLIDREVGND
jgi:hypothetical protein